MSKLNTSISLFSLCSLLFVFASFMAAVWHKNKPVMEYIKAEGIWTVIGETAKNNFTGKKKRDCSRISGSEVGYTYHSNVISESHFEYVDDETPNSSFPPGVIDIGYIQWWSEHMQEADAVGFSITHNCEGIVVVSRFKFSLP